MPMNDRRRFTGLLDLIDGGGAGRAGNEFEGGLLSDILNALGVRPRGFEERQERMASVMPMARPAPMQPAPAPVAPAPVPLSAQPGFLSPDGPQALPAMLDMPSATERYMAQYGVTPEQMMLAAAPGGLTAPSMDAAPTLPASDMPRTPRVGYMPQPAMPSDPSISLDALVSLPIDPITGLPLAMTPPRLPY